MARSKEYSRQIGLKVSKSSHRTSIDQDLKRTESLESSRFRMPLTLVDAELTLKPQINKRSTQIKRNVSDLFDWQEQLKQRREEAIRRREAEIKAKEDEAMGFGAVAYVRVPDRREHSSFITNMSKY